MTDEQVTVLTQLEKRIMEEMDNLTEEESEVYWDGMNYSLSILNDYIDEEMERREFNN